MKITYIYHSGFCVEMESECLIFDYYKGIIPKIPQKKRMHVFVSHKHGDHYNPEIFQLATKYSNITFYLPNDMKMSKRYMEHKGIPIIAQNKIIYLKKNDQVETGQGMVVNTFRSTDEGVAFLVHVEDQVIYHAGDLNCWVWEGESKNEQEQMRRAFCTEVDKLKGMNIDVAFLPLDPRLEKSYSLGFDYFMRTTQTKTAIPMHFWEQPEIIQAFCKSKEAKEYENCIMALTRPGEMVEIDFEI